MFYKILYLLRYLVNSKKFKKFITIVLLVFALMSFFEIKSHAAEEITSPYYFDGVAATYKDYEALQNDFVTRVLNSIKTNGGFNYNGLYANLFNRITNGGYVILFYYGDAIGTHYMNTAPSASQKNIIEIIQMDASQVTSNTNNYDWGLNGVQSVRGYVCATNYYEFKINRNNISAPTLSPNTARHYMPTYLVDYKSDSLVELLHLYVTQQLNLNSATNLLDAIENQTDTIEEQGQTITNSINDTNDFLQEDVSNEVSTDLVVEPIEENEQQEEIEDFVTYFPNKIAEEIADFDINAGRGNYYVEFTLPHTNGKKITFYSDAIYKYLVGTPFEIVVQMISFFWYLTLGGMIIIKIKRIYDWFAAGNFLREGEFIKFTDVLRGENEFFNQFMM